MGPLGWALIQGDRCPYQKGKPGHSHTERECHVKRKAEVRRHFDQGTPRLPAKCQEPGDIMELTLPQGPQEKPALLTP